MNHPANTATDQWEVVEYEAIMLFELCRLLGDQAFQPVSKLVVNAVVESACLHTRILVDILLPPKSSRDDDIRLDQLLPGFEPPSLNQLRVACERAAYVVAGEQRSPRWILNKLLAHPTRHRGKNYDYTAVLKELLPHIDAVWQEIMNYRRGSTPKSPKPSGCIDPRMCAVTCSFPEFKFSLDALPRRSQHRQNQENP